MARESQAIPLKIQQDAANTGSTDAGVAPIQAGELRKNAIKALTLAQTADVVSANYKAAADKVQQIIDLKYKPIEDKIATLKTQLELNKTYITDPADKKRAEALNLVLAERTRLLEQQKADDTAKQNIALEVAKIDPAASAGIADASSIADAIKMAAPTLAKGNNEFQKVGDNLYLVNKVTGQVIKNYGSGNVTSGSGIPSAVVRTVSTTTGAAPVSGYTLAQGDDPYVVAQNNGITMDKLKELNPGVQDWTKLPVGTVLNLPNNDESWLKGKSDQQVSSYNGLNATDKSSIKQLVTGSALLTDLVKSRGDAGTKEIARLTALAKNVDPNFSVNQNKQRFSYQTQFNNPNSKSQTQITAINTGLGHLAEFKSAADALGNSILLPYNKLVNYLSSNAGDPKISNLNTVITALSSELATIYKGGTAPSTTEIEDWKKNILSSFSDSQSAGVASTTANLISNRMLSLNNAYKNVMGNYPDSPIVNADAVQQLIDSGVDVSSIVNRLKEQGYNPPTSPSVGADNATLSPYGFSPVNDGKDSLLLKQFGL